MPFAGGGFHQPVRAVPGIEPERLPHEQQRSRHDETDTYPLVDACHVHDDKQDEQGEQSAGEDEQVLAFQPLELRAAADSLVDRILRHNQRKNERKIVAATIKKMQAPNQLAAVLEVSGSPEENLE